MTMKETQKAPRQKLFPIPKFKSWQHSYVFLYKVTYKVEARYILEEWQREEGGGLIYYIHASKKEAAVLITINV